MPCAVDRPRPQRVGPRPDRRRWLLRVLPDVATHAPATEHARRVTLADALVALVALVAFTGCLRDTEFLCDTDDQCGPGGTCDPTSHCVFDGDPIDPGSCPAGFVPIGGHHYLRIDDASWTEQLAACSAPGIYLAVPDDAAELAAIADLNGSNKLWLGIDDRADEGTFVDATGAPATFLPWKDGSPDDEEDDRDCVAADSATEIIDDDCEQRYAAVCECER